MDEEAGPSIDALHVRLSKDMTLQWPCRSGDFLIWFHCLDIFASPVNAFSIVDLWETRSGDSVTITNRTDDLPEWFELHPTEVCNSLVYEMMRKLNSGYVPEEVVDGPNIWRLRAGDRVVWIGKSRPERQAIDGLLALLECGECALAFGESNRSGLDNFLAFGSLSKEGQNIESLEQCRQAVKAIARMGLPRELAETWQLG